MDLKEKPNKFLVRLPLALRHQIGEAAQYHHRSMNSEIVARLEQSFSGLPSQGSAQQLAPEMHDELTYFFGRTLTSDEEQIVRGYRRLSVDKKTALVELLS